MTTFEKISLGVQVGVAVVGIFASIFVSNVLSELREISGNVVRVVDGIERLVNIDGEKVQQTAEQVSGAAVVVGDGAAGAIANVRGAIHGHTPAAAETAEPGKLDAARSFLGRLNGDENEKK
ncbi:hypothetical protein KUV57_11435 [Epibacterium sp. DP7N7-1]|nr:hypothetical protein [Epibacterium sp. DP7N7-1]